MPPPKPPAFPIFGAGDRRPPPVVVAVGGLDPGGGAGICRDRATAVALGARARLVGTAWTEQSPAGVAAVEPRAPDAVRAALAAAWRAEEATCAVKVGMVATPAIAQAIVDALDGFRGAVVLDPVLGATSGGALFAGDAAALMPLARRATLVTPNLAEAAALTGRAVATADDARAAGRALVDAGVAAVLVKGGHLAGDAVDLLVTAGGERSFAAARVAGPSPRGTGCALATAIAVGLASRMALDVAIAAAKEAVRGWIAGARQVGDEWHLGEATTASATPTSSRG